MSVISAEHMKDGVRIEMPKGGEALEVRCCCDAHLIGFLAHPGLRKQGDRWSFSLRIPAPEKSYVPKKWDDSIPLGPSALLLSIDLRVSTIVHSTGAGRVIALAIKSNDYPIEHLRLISGFREATPEDIARDEHDPR